MAQLVFLILIRWLVIYPVDSAIQSLNNQSLGSASDWSCLVENLLQPIRSTTQISEVKRHQYGIFALVSKYDISRRKQW